MKIIEENLKFDKNNSKSHIRYNFSLDKDYEKLKIYFSYTPSVVEKEIARKVASETALKYIPKDYKDYEMVYDIMADFRVLNLLMISVSKDGEFLGSYHNEKNNQELFISKDESSLGFSCSSIEKGDYLLTISLLNINSDVKASLKVEVE